MAIGRYPVPPPSSGELTSIFGPKYQPNLQENPNASKTPISPNSANKSATLSHSNSNSGDCPRLSIFELLDYIVNEPQPTVPAGVFSSEFKDLVDCCLKKNPVERPDLKTLMVSHILGLYPICIHLNVFFQNHPFVKRSEAEDLDFARWICDVMHLTRHEPSTPSKNSADA